MLFGPILQVALQQAPGFGNSHSAPDGLQHVLPAGLPSTCPQFPLQHCVPLTHVFERPDAMQTDEVHATELLSVAGEGHPAVHALPAGQQVRLAPFPHGV